VWNCCSHKQRLAFRTTIRDTIRQPRLATIVILRKKLVQKLHTEALQREEVRLPSGPLRCRGGLGKELRRKEGSVGHADRL